MAKLLYDFDYEGDRICLIQTLLLMTYWYDTPDYQKDSWHWLGLAISLARTISLNHDSQSQYVTMEERRLQRRLWWCCVMRDPMTALGMGKATYIKREDYAVSMLTLDDFEISGIPSEASRVSKICGLARDAVKQRKQAIMCIEQAKLCQIGSKVLSLQNDLVESYPKSKAMARNLWTTALLFPVTDEPDEFEFDSCDEDLQTWLKALPAEAAFSIDTDKEDRGLIVLRGTLHMIYHTAVSILHRPRSFRSSSSRCADLGGWQLSPAHVSHEKILHSAAVIAYISKDLHYQRLSRFLPITGVSALVTAMISYIIDFNLSGGIMRQSTSKGYGQCMVIMEELRENYTAADFAVQFLTDAAKAGLQHTSKSIIQDGQREGVQSTGAIDGSVYRRAGKPLVVAPRHHTMDLRPPIELEPLATTLDFNDYCSNDGAIDGLLLESPPTAMITPGPAIDIWDGLDQSVLDVDWMNVILSRGEILTPGGHA
jgi:hypothetical protein